EAVSGGVKEGCPRGVDVYFDNVGGEITDAVMRRLALNARLAICGQISTYHANAQTMGPRNLGALIVARARIEGFLINDFAHRFAAVLPRLAQWLVDGK